MIHKLKETFNGVGEVKGFTFNLLKRTKDALMYSVCTGEKTHYEVFEIKTTPVCINFEERLYSDIESKEVYPKSKDFGKWAYSFSSFSKAEEKLDDLTKTQKEKS